MQGDTALFVCVRVGVGMCGWMGWEGHGCQDPVSNAMHKVFLSVFYPPLSFPEGNGPAFTKCEYAINSRNTHISIHTHLTV